MHGGLALAEGFVAGQGDRGVGGQGHDRGTGDADAITHLRLANAKQLLFFAKVHFNAPANRNSSGVGSFRP